MRSMVLRAIALLAVVTVGGGCRVGAPRHESLSPNAGCYVCHMTFVGEPIAAVHLPEGITCTECHGLSAGHANDENIGATPPDVVYARAQVNPHCRTCHETHDAPPERVIAQWRHVVASRPSGGAIPTTPVCTDCHGQHRIAAAF